MNRAQWLAWRRGGLGGSDVAAVLGLSPFRGPWDVWLTKTVDEQAEADSAAMMTGRLLEEAVGKWAAVELEADELVEWPPLAHPTQDWVRASPDYGLRFGDRVVGLECKVATWPSEEHGWGKSGSGDIPAHYAAQVRWYMAAISR